MTEKLHYESPGAHFAVNAVLCAVIAHSAVFYSRLAWEPVADAVCGFGGLVDETAQEQETLTEQQVSSEGGGDGSLTQTAGAGAVIGGFRNSKIGGGRVSSGGTENISITNPDPAAVAAVAATSQTALDDAASVALGAEGIAETAIDTVSSTSDAALTTVGNNSTALEEIASQYEQGLLDAESSSAVVANNATTGNSQPIQYSDIAGQESQSSTLQKFAFWAVIISSVATVIYFITRHKK